MRFTRKSVASLVLPPGKPYAIFWDSELPGFGVRLNPTSKVWVVQYRVGGQSRRETIGRLETISLDSARDAARNTLARVQLGGDPRAEKSEAAAIRALTFQSAVDRYLKSAADRLKTRSYTEVSRHLSKDWAAFAKLPLKTINRTLISSTLEGIAEASGPIAANRARASLSALYSFALSLGLCDQNPVIGTIKPGREIARDRVLSDLDIAAIWNACNTNDHGCIVKLLLLTGQRRDEVGDMRWSEIDLGSAIWTLPSPRTKNGKSHEVPLSLQSLVILQGRTRIVGRDHVFGNGQNGFSGWSKAKASLDGRLAELPNPPAPWRIHDLRRTAATKMASLGVAPHIVEAVLNHISGSRAGVAGIYNRATYREEKRAALDTWARHLDQVISKWN